MQICPQILRISTDFPIIHPGFSPRRLEARRADRNLAGAASHRIPTNKPIRPGRDDACTPANPTERRHSFPRIETQKRVVPRMRDAHP